MGKLCGRQELRGESAWLEERGVMRSETGKAIREQIRCFGPGERKCWFGLVWWQESWRKMGGSTINSGDRINGTC